MTEQTVAKRGRFEKVSSVYEAYHRYMEEHESLCSSFARIQGLIDGNAPYPAAELQKLGQGWRANVNWREAEAIRDSNVAAYWELVAEVHSLVDVKFKRSAVGPQPSAEMLQALERIIAEELTELLKTWEDFVYNYSLMTTEFWTYGIAPIISQDEYTWKFDVFKRQQFIVPAQTKSKPSGLRFFFIRDTMTAERIADLLDNKQASARGWKTRMLRKMLLNIVTDGARNRISDKYQLGTFGSLQQAYKNGDLDLDTDFDVANIAHFFFLDQDGKVNHGIIFETEDLSDWVFLKLGQYPNMEGAAIVITLNPGDGFIRSVKGMGHKIFAGCEFSNRFINGTMDGALIGASVICQATSTQSADKLEITRIGPVTVFPRDLSIVQQTFAPRITELVGARAMIQQTLEQNAGVFRTSGRGFINQVPRTAREAEIAAQNESRLEKNSAAYYYAQWDRVVAKIFARLVGNPPSWVDGADEAAAFVKACVDRGVPKEWMSPEFVRVRASRAIGLGSPTMRQLLTQQGVAMSGMFDQAGQDNMVREWVAARFGESNVERFKAAVTSDFLPSNEESIATIENNEMAAGREAVVGFNQIHIRHLTIHVKPLAEQVRLIRQLAGNPRAAQATHAYWSRALPHCEMHLRYGSQTPAHKDQMKLFAQVINQASALLPQLVKAIKQGQIAAQAAAAAADQNAQIDPETQMRMRKMMLDNQVDTMEAEARMKLRETQMRHNLALKDAREAAKIETERRRLEMEEEET